MKWEKSQIANLKSQIPELPDEKYQKFLKHGLPAHYANLAIATPSISIFVTDAIKVADKVGVDTKTVGDWIFNRSIDFDNTEPAKIIAQIVKSKEDVSISDEEVKRTIEQVIAKNTKAVNDYQKGKEQALGFLVGQAKRQSPNLNTEILIERLKKLL